MRITITPVNIALNTTSNKIIIYTSGCITGGSSGGGTWGSITGTLSDQTDLQNALNAKANANNVLAKDNTTAFTPDADYEPSTKKYVDDIAITKVDKVTGKQLSTEDYTTAEKNKLTGVEAGAQVNPSLKTINGESIEGTGNIVISGGLDKTFQTLTYAAQITTDGSISVNSVVTLTGATAKLQIPINPVLGELFTWDVIQDAVGGRLLTYAAGFQFSGGIVPILSASANAKDSLTFICKAANIFEFKYATFDVKTP